MIVTSTALIKSRINNAKIIVNDLMSGSLIPDKIYFFISEESHNIDEGIKPHEIPVIDNPRVEFIYTPNIGSLRKIVPIVKRYWSHKHQRIILFDDDFRITKDTVKNLITYQQHINHRFHACGIAGNIFARDKPYEKRTRLEKKIGRSVEFGWVLKQPKQVDMLSSGLGLLVKPKFFHKDILQWEKYKEEFGVNYSDECFVNYLLAKNGIPRFVIPITKCPLELPSTRRLSDGGDFGYMISKFKKKQTDAWYKKLEEWK